MKTVNTIRSSLFLRFLGMYLIVLLIPVIFSWITYKQILTGYIEEIQRTNLGFLIRTREMIDNYFSSMEWKAYHIGRLKQLKELTLLSRSEIQTGNFKVKEFITELSSYFLYDEDLTTTCYIYLKKSDIIITPETSFPVTLFNQSSRFSPTDPGLWHRNLEKNYYRGVFFPSTRIQNEMLNHSEELFYIPYVQSLPVLNYSAPSEGAIVFLTSEKRIEDLIKRFNLPAGGSAFITDETGNLITSLSTGGEKQTTSQIIETTETEGIILRGAGSGKQVTIFTTSPKNSWRYTIQIPYSYLTGRLGYSRSIMFWFLSISLLFGVITAIYLSYRNSRPLQKIVNMLEETPDSGRDFSGIHRSVSKLIKNSRNLQAELDKQVRFAGRLFLTRLLRGNFRNEEEIAAGLSFARMEIPEKKFVVLLIDFPDYANCREKELIDELEMTKVVIREMASHILTDRFYIGYMEEPRLAIILAYPDRLDSECQERAETAAGHLREKLKAIHTPPFQMACGGVAAGLLQLPKGMKEAEEALNFKTPEQEILFYSRLPAEREDYYYPIEVEMDLINVIKAGDGSQAQEILNNIYLINTHKRKLPTSTLESLLFELRGTFIKLKEYIMSEHSRENESAFYAIEETLIREISKTSFKKSFALIRKSTEEICKVIDDKKKSHNTQLKDQIVHYLTSNYSNPELSLYHVASRFNLTEVYLSLFFKEQNGVNFSWYLEKLRINHSCQLLAEGTLSVNEIAGKTGYSSDKAFRRAFKRVMKIPPTQYRRQFAQSQPHE